MINLETQTPQEICRDVAVRIRLRRKERGFTQEEVAKRAGMSLSSYKRIEQGRSVTLMSLVKISVALGCQDDFAGLFSKRGYASIEEVINGSG